MGNNVRDDHSNLHNYGFFLKYFLKGIFGIKAFEWFNKKKKSSPSYYHCYGLILVFVYSAVFKPQISFHKIVTETCLYVSTGRMCKWVIQSNSYCGLFLGSRGQFKLRYFNGNICKNYFQILIKKDFHRKLQGFPHWFSELKTKERDKHVPCAYLSSSNIVSVA